MELIENTAIYESLQNKVRRLLREKFSVNKPFPMEQAISALKDDGILSHSINSEKELFMFFEQFTSFLRVNHRDCTVSLFDSDEVKDYYYAATEAMRDMGYDSSTRLQERAFLDSGFWKNHHILIMGNTSSGKTLIPVVKFICDNQKNHLNKKMMIAVPYRALAMQMNDNLKRCLKKYNFIIRVSTSEISDFDSEIKNGKPDISIVIYEKLFMFLSKNPEMLEKYDYLTLDEIGILQSEERGIKADYLLAQAIRISDFKIVLLATPYCNYTEYETKYGFYNIMLLSRPIPIEEYFFLPKKDKFNNTLYRQYDSAGIFLKNIKPKNFENTFNNLVQCELDEGKKIIVFHFSTKEIRKRAKQFADKFNKCITIQQLNDFKKRFFEEYGLVEEELSSTFKEDWQYDALMNGVTFHHASLPERLRGAIEQEFLETPRVIPGGIKLIFATETLAYGINGNVDTVIITSMRKRDISGYRPLSINEYQNCIGRSGRLGYVNQGKSYCFLMPIKDTNFHDVKEITSYYSSYSKDSLPKIISKIRETLNSENWSRIPFLLLSIIPDKEGVTVSGILNILGFDNNEEIKNGIRLTLNYLESCRFITEYEDLFADFGEKRYVASVSGALMRGCLISTETYDKMAKAYKFLPRTTDGVFYIMDYCRMIADLDEKLLNFGEIIRRADKKLNPSDQRREINEANSVVNLWKKIMKMTNSRLISDNWISDKLRVEIEGSEYFKHIQKGNSLNDRLFNELLKTTVSLIITLWLHGYSEALIYDVMILNKDNDGSCVKIDNIKRRWGEKMSYLTDIFKAVAKVNGCTFEEEKFLAQLSRSAFYGIRLDWMREWNIDLLKDDTSRELRIKSITSRREEFDEAKERFCLEEGSSLQCL